MYVYIYTYTCMYTHNALRIYYICIYIYTYIAGVSKVYTSHVQYIP